MKFTGFPTAHHFPVVKYKKNAGRYNGYRSNKLARRRYALSTYLVVFGNDVSLPATKK